MATLTGQYIASSYKDLLQVSNSNSGIDSTYRYISDGEGTNSTVQISTTGVKINDLAYPTSDGTSGQALITDGAGTLSFSNVASELNGLADVTITSADSGDFLRYNGSAWVDVAVTQLETDINHDNLTGFVANEHIDWTSTSSNLDTSGTLKSSDLTLLNGGVIAWRNSGDTINDVTITHSTNSLAFAGVSGAGAYSFDYNVSVTGNITVSGTVDGRDVATDGTKLDGIEANATADQTTEEIQDAAWSAVATGTQTGITVTYQDTTNDVDFVVSDLTVAGDSGSTGMTPGDTLTIAGGTNATTAMSGDILTVNVDDAFLSNTGDTGSGAYTFSGTVDCTGTEAIKIPVGTTAQRPGTPADGDLRVNSTSGTTEIYRSASWRDLEAGGGSGTTVQRVYTTSTTQGSTTTTIPFDNTIPQNTEGAEFMTLSITPNNTSNVLIIEVSIPVVDSSASNYWTGAIFQDSTADALAAAGTSFYASTYTDTFYLRHIMAAGTTSATTFKFRYGTSSGTAYILRSAGSATDVYSTSCIGTMTITEYTP